MDSEEFIIKLTQSAQNSVLWHYFWPYAQRKNCKNKYHIILHISAFETFLNSYQSIVIPFRNFAVSDHIHIIVFSPIQIVSSQNIRSIQITEPSQLKFNFCQLSHDSVCKILFRVPSLEITCMKSILNNLSGHVSNLKLPNRIIKNLFELSKYFSNAIYYDGTNVIDDEPIFRMEFFFFDTLYNKFDFCLDCMNMEIENGTFKRIYKLCFNEFVTLEDLHRNPNYWCNACKKIPLFKVLSDKEVYEKYNYDFLNLEISNISQLIQIDQFVNGVKTDENKFDLECLFYISALK